MSSVRVCSFESRRSVEIAKLIEKQGGVATVAPSMREIPLDENEAVYAFADKLLAGQIDVVVFFTGVGARAVHDVVTTRHSRDEFLAALERVTVCIRGPKPAAVLKEWGTRVDVRAPEPNTWEELLAAMEAHPLDLAGKAIAVQEYGLPNGEFYFELERRGAEVLPVPVYRWGFPEEPGPLLAAVHSVVAGDFDVLMFTSAQQVTNVLKAASDEGVEHAFRESSGRLVIASVGPTCSDALRDAGLHVTVEASPPKMGPLVRVAMEAGRSGSVEGRPRSDAPANPLE